jgi:hypothetical protein
MAASNRSAASKNELGRVVQAIDDLGVMDNTLIIYITGDNGSSGNGGPTGRFTAASSLGRRGGADGGRGVECLVGCSRKRAAGRAQIGTQKVGSCTTVERYRKSTLGLRIARRSQRAKCSACRYGGDTSFLHFGQATVGCPTCLARPSKI